MAPGVLGVRLGVADDEERGWDEEEEAERPPPTDEELRSIASPERRLSLVAYLRPHQDWRGQQQQYFTYYVLCVLQASVVVLGTNQ